MSSSQPRYPILVDTDALIAVANSKLWDTLIDHVGLTTTNVCEHELKRHCRETRETAPEGSREHRLHYGSKHALEALEDDQVPLTRITTVPRPHGSDAGEQSLRQEVVQKPESVESVIMMDADGRRSLRRTIQENEYDIRVLAPPFLFYILYDNDIISKAEFCETTGALLTAEGWTGYQAVQAAWSGIPVDCSAFVDTDLLP